MHSVKPGQAPGSKMCSVTASFDYWIGEAEYGFVNSSGDTMAHMYIRGNYILKDGPAIVGAVDFGLTDPDGSAYETGYTMKLTLELPYGNYDIWLTDTYGDGWAWNDVGGENVMKVEGCVDTPYTMDFMGSSSATGSRTVSDPFGGGEGGISGETGGRRGCCQSRR